MFRETTTRFRRNYYQSCLIIPVGLLIIFIVVSSLEKNDFNLKVIFSHVLSEKKFTFLFLIFIFLKCGWSLYALKKDIDDAFNRFNSNSSNSRCYIKNIFNPGFRDFLLSCLLPLMSTFSFSDFPLATVTMFCSMLGVMYYFYKNSSDFFPNLPLSVLGYTLFAAVQIDTSEAEPQEVYVFGDTNKISEFVLSERYISYLEKSDDKTKKIGIIR